MRRTTLAKISLFVWAVIGTGSLTEAGQLFPTTSHDFGTVPRGAQLLHKFRWANPHKTPLEVLEVRSGCGCATATPVPRILEPGQTGVIVVSMDAKKFLGQKTVAIHVLVGPEEPHTVTLQVTAHCRPDIVYNPGHVNFGVISQGTTATQTLEMEYAGALDWRVTELLPPGPHLEASYEEMYRRPGQVGYRVKARLKPEAPAGDFQHELQFRTNDPASPLVPVLVEATIKAPVTATPDPLYFGSVRTGQIGTRRVILRGDGPFHVTQVEGLEDGLTVALPSHAAAVHNLVVNWQPRQGGQLNKQLVFHTDAEKHTKITVTIQGHANP
jgi:hypothetical protein